MTTNRNLPSREDGAADRAALPERTLRADARKNRDKLLEVARRVFTTEGVSVSMDEIARRAGVGVGTVYRHFPTKEELFEAVFVRFKTDLIEEAARLLDHVDPGEAFYSYFERSIRDAVANKAITDALVGSGLNRIGQAEIAREFWRGIDALLARAKESGSVREDARLEDIRMLLIGVLQAVGDGGEYPDRLVAILCDGLRGGPRQRQDPSR